MTATGPRKSKSGIVFGHSNNISYNEGRIVFYFHEDYRRYLMDELLNGRTNVPTHPTQITFLKTSLISFKSVMDG